MTSLGEIAKKASIIIVLVIVAIGVGLWYSTRPDSIDSILEKKAASCGRRVHFRAKVTEMAHGNAYWLTDPDGSQTFINMRFGTKPPDIGASYDVFGVILCGGVAGPVIEEVRRLQVP